MKYNQGLQKIGNLVIKSFKVATNDVVELSRFFRKEYGLEKKVNAILHWSDNVWLFEKWHIEIEAKLIDPLKATNTFKEAMTLLEKAFSDGRACVLPNKLEEQEALLVDLTKHGKELSLDPVAFFREG